MPTSARAAVALTRGEEDRAAQLIGGFGDVKKPPKVGRFMYNADMGKHIHKLTEKDFENKTGVCSFCGPVKIRIKSGVWRCQVSVNQHRGPRLQPHGLTQEQAAVFRQHKSCEICGSNGRLTVDHCHKNNFIRGVLCHPCNMGIGHFKDKPNLLRAAADYLESKQKSALSATRWPCGLACLRRLSIMCDYCRSG